MFLVITMSVIMFHEISTNAMETSMQYSRDIHNYMS